MIEVLKWYFTFNPLVEVFLWWSVGALLVLLYFWIEKRRKEKIKIPFSSFCSFYEVNKEGWNIEGSTPTYRKGKEFFRISFSIADCIRFKRWKRKKMREEWERVENQRALRFTNYIRADIRNSFPTITLPKR